MRTKIQTLRKEQKNTLDQIVRTPVSQGIKWSDIESLAKALGRGIKEERGSRCKFILGMSATYFHRSCPSPDTDKGAVESVRDWLLNIGVKS